MTTINVTTETAEILVTETTGASTTVTTACVPSILTAVTAGPQGPQGPPGETGSAYVYLQASAAATWIINHNLGYRPAVELLDAGSQEIDGEIAHPSANQTVVTLNPATAGIARLT